MRTEWTNYYVYPLDFPFLLTTFFECWVLMSGSQTALAERFLDDSADPRGCVADIANNFRCHPAVLYFAQGTVVVTIRQGDA